MNTYVVDLSEIVWDAPAEEAPHNNSVYGIVVEAETESEAKSLAIDNVSDDYEFCIESCVAEIRALHPANTKEDKIRNVLRKYFETDPFAGKPSDIYDVNFSAEEAIDEIVAIL